MGLKGILVASVLGWGLAVAPATFAKQPDAALLERVEASLVVTGTVDIEPDGSVSGYALDQPEQIPEYVRAALAGRVPAWRFEPVLVEGEPVRARSPMSVRMLAKPVGEEGLAISVSGASFGESGDHPAPARKRFAPPRYPTGPLYDGVQGDVYLLLKVNLQGAVDDVAVEQVNLRTLVPEGRMEAMRREFAKASTRAARAWRWTRTDAENAPEEGYWTFRMPVAFSIGRPGDDMEPEYGQWQPYLPGPRHRPGWVPESDASAPDALLAGEPQALGRGPKLLTPLSDS
ncbi:energy transducer TonB [Lysobacter sp. GX 14042]|uniref:energy transducer TonB n=1 Tax=Lysobacter sp. GX 14042 TaxID=2907155 RepID=UPI001F36EE49|nr:energy transducer TonB [Lysobacter sp. GX 14042]MCE7032123.1 energy transducer TonB [Lysobacter sp. GX 14042]